jgi:uncharacterized protein (TIGR02145 family)
MILTHGANSLQRGGDTVTIGGRAYPVVKIGKQLWMAENLDYSDSTITCSYPNNDSATYGYNGLKYGAYYNKDEYDLLSSYIQANVPDWHLAIESDLRGLDSLLGSSIGIDLCSTSGWSGTQGNDTYNFNLKPAGFIDNYGTFTDEHTAAYLRTEAGHCWIAPDFTAFSYWNNDYNTTYYKFPVRLVKDLA